MGVHSKIENILSDYVNGNIWPEYCPLENKPKEFIVYCDTDDEAGDYGDDAPGAWTQAVEVNWYKKGPGKKAVNYLAVRKEIKARLENAGLSVYRIIPGYEKDTGYTTLVFLFEVMDDGES